MELLDAAAVARWLHDDLHLESVAKMAEENGVNGDVLLALLNADGGLTRIGVTDVLDVSKIRGGATRLTRQHAIRNNRDGSGRAPKRPRLSVPASPFDEPASSSTVSIRALADSSLGLGLDRVHESWVWASIVPIDHICLCA